MKKFSEILKIASVFTGAVLGAGFAGGRELVNFFVHFGKNGIYASIVAGLLFLCLGSLILYKSHFYNQNTFEGYLSIIFSKKFAHFINIVCEVFLLVCFFIMLSGGGALAEELFAIPSYVGSIITAIITFLVLSHGIEGIGTASSILTPIMIVGILYVDIVSLLTNTMPVSLFEIKTDNNFLLSAILYVSYNMLSATPVLVSCSSLAKSRHTATAGGIAGGIALTSVCLLSCLVLFLADSDSLLSELPLLAISGKINQFSYTAYAIVLYMAILTTAFSSGLPLVKKIESLSFSTRTSVALLCIVSVPLSFLKFSVLIEYCYTFFGYLGLLLIAAIILDFLKFRYLKKIKGI